MERNLALEFVRVTEAAAIAASSWFGKNDKNAADQAAVDAMRRRFPSLDMDGEVVIGEGEKDEAPFLYTGEKLGNKKGPKMDIAVDPLECTTNLAEGRLNSMSILCAAPRGHLLKVPGTYMDKIAVGPGAKGTINIAASAKENIRAVAEALGKKPHEVVVCVLKRPRHDQLLADIRKAGAKIALIDSGDVAGSLATCAEHPYIDIMMGVGGAPEGIITAAALQCLGGDIQAVLKCHDEKAKDQAEELGIKDLDKVYTMNDLAKPDNCLFAGTGISDGPLLRGVRWQSDKPITHSVVMRSKSKTVRFIEAHHRGEYQ